MAIAASSLHSSCIRFHMQILVWGDLSGCRCCGRFGCREGVEGRIRVSTSVAAFLGQAVGNLGVVSAVANRLKSELSSSRNRENAGQVEETGNSLATRSQKIEAIRMRQRRSVSDNGHGVSRQHSLHASTKCRPQSATPLRAPFSSSITKTRYGTSPHWPQWSYACMGMRSSPIQGLTHPRMLSPDSGVQLPPLSVIAFTEQC
jgi:hypothetical protein